MLFLSAGKLTRLDEKMSARTVVVANEMAEMLDRVQKALREYAAIDESASLDSVEQATADLRRMMQRVFDDVDQVASFEMRRIMNTY